MFFGFQSLLGNLDSAVRTFQNYYSVWRQFGGLPEFYSIPQGYTVDKREGYPLRPGESADGPACSSTGSVASDSVGLYCLKAEAALDKINGGSFKSPSNQIEKKQVEKGVLNIIMVRLDAKR